jgi:EAL domain-containing protein (putative c-di-GMP-specific phosphodiesterase class I)/HPt (histidine-containing phosphotransfer) domain-containing protein
LHFLSPPDTLLTLARGDRQKAARIAALFLQSTPESVEDMIRASAESGYADLARAAHKLKSGAAALGAVGLASALQELEGGARSGDAHAVGTWMPIVQKRAEHAMLTMRAAFLCPPPPNPHPIGKVLLVDDDELMLAITEDYFRRLGVPHIGLACSGSEAIHAIAREGWDLLVCDLQMPRMDGIQLARRLAEHRFAGSVALASGLSPRLTDTVVHLLEAHKLRCVGNWKKPLTEETVRAILLATAREASPVVQEVEHVALRAARLEEGLREGGHLQAWLQPKVATGTLEPVGAECLARWRDSDGTLVSPVRFIPVAEASGLIIPLTEQLFQLSLAHARSWLTPRPNLKLSLNLSMDSLNDIDLPDKLLQWLEDARMPPGRITLELTESRLIEQPRSALEVLTRLRLNGFGLSIDDFGTGHSNLVKLQRLPFTELKVDRSFVRAAAQERAAAVIFRSSVEIAHSLGMTAVAEGVETDQDIRLATDMGCDELQGFGLGKPMPPAQFDEWLAARR